MTTDSPDYLWPEVYPLKDHQLLTGKACPDAVLLQIWTYMDDPPARDLRQVRARKLVRAVAGLHQPGIGAVFTVLVVGALSWHPQGC